MTTTRRWRGFATMMAVVLVASGILPLPTSSSAEAVTRTQAIEEEVYEAFGVAMGTIATGTISVQIRINRWTTDEERETLLTTLANQGAQPTLRALNAQDETGRVGLGTALPYALRYARESVVNNRRRIILATDRPISVGEARNAGRSLDYGFSLIQLDLDDEGNGDGVLLVGAQLKLDPETNVLSIEAADTGVRLNNVRKR